MTTDTDRSAPATASPLVRAPSHQGGRPRARSLWSPAGVLRDSVYLLASWPVLLLGLVLVLVLVATGAAMVVVWVGFPLLAAGLLAAHALGGVERGAQAALLGREVAAPLPSPVAATGWRRALAMLRDPQRVADLAFALLAWVPATLTWALAVALWAAVGSLLSAPVWLPLLPDGARAQDMATLLHLPDSVLAHDLADVVTGLVLLVVAAPVLRLLAAAQATVNAWLLTAPTRTAREARAHREQMGAARDAEIGALQRLERDIHDGPQQRLVRLQMDLARASRQWERDPEAAHAMVDSAVEQARGALDELRAATRGIAPPLLVDRGLDAALHELAGRAAVPTTTTCALPRLNAGYEAALYYAASEALTNAAKHSGAAEARLSAFVDGPWAVVEVRDEGVGGARVGAGSGLTGLAQRLHGLGGRLTVTSAEGGPTLVRAEVPCAS